MNIKNKLNISAIILGLTSMIGQIIVIRELIVVFYGNELSLGAILASWLFWTAIGSSVFGRLVDKISFKTTLLAAIQLVISIILPLNILLIRYIKSLLNISTGEIIGLQPMFMVSFLSLSLICVLLGFTFTLISKLASENSSSPAGSIGKIYLLEGLGASMGGLLYSLYLIKVFSQFHNSLIVSCFNIIISIFFARNIIQLVLLAALGAAFIFNWPRHVDGFVRSLQFRPFKVVESIDSIYGNIAVTKSGNDYSFYENGLLMFTTNDFLTSEESVHYAMLEHPAPKKVLLIGGGVSGSLEQILKHDVDRIDYVELDPLIIELARKYVPVPADKKINFINADGRLFIKSAPSPSLLPIAEGDGEKVRVRGYDVIIANLPDPYTAMLNRFYSLEYFREAKKLLADGGILSFSLSSSENYINPENAAYLGCIFHTLEKVFSEIKLLPGDNVVFLASDKKDLLTHDTGLLLKRLGDRKIKTQFVREYYLPFKLSPLRIKYVENTLKEFGGRKINTDFRPIGYFYHMLLWLTLFSAGRGILPHIGIFNIWLFIGVVTTLFLIMFMFQKLRRSSFRTPVRISIGATGMSEICFQIIVILAFQFLYGYVYYKIGLILTSFMIGLVLGSFFINRRLERIQDERSLYLKTQAAICLYPLVLPLAFKIPDFQLGFAFLPIIAGFLGGFQFPLANKICLKSSSNVGKTTGTLYGLDLFGACVGGLLVGLLLIPLLGITQTCLILFIINTLVLILLFSSSR